MQLGVLSILVMIFISICQKVAYLERLNATQQLERGLVQFFALYEKQNGIKLDNVQIPGDEVN